MPDFLRCLILLLVINYFSCLEITYFVLYSQYYPIMKLLTQNTMKAISLFIIILLIHFNARAVTVTYSGLSGGNWNTPGNWSTGSLPGTTDSVIIPNGLSVTVDVNADITSLNMGTGNTATTLTINSGITLTISNVLNFSQVTSTVSHILSVGAGTVSCKNLIMSNNNGNSRISRISISTGKLTVSRDITFNGSRTVENQIVFSGAGTLLIGGNFNPSFHTFTTVTGSKVVFNGSLPQTIKAGFIFRKLQFYGTGVKTFTGTTTTLVGSAATDSLDIRAGTTVNVGTMILQANAASVKFNVAGTLQTDNTVGLNGSTTTTFSSTNTPTITLVAGSVIEYEATVAQAVTTRTYEGLTISGNSTKTISGTVTVNQGLVINSTATLVHNATTLTVTGNISGAGNLTTTSGTINIAGDFTLTGTYTRGTGTVNYNKAGTQIVNGIAYNNLTISGSGAKSLQGNATVNAILLLTAGTLNINSKALTLAGTFSASGTGTLVGSNTSTLFINGTGALGTLRFDNTSRVNKTLDSLVINRTTSGTVTLNNAATADTLLIKGLLQLTNGAVTTNGRLLLISDATGTARVGTVTAGSLVGNIHVERFIPGGSGKRKWRLMSFPVNDGNGLMTWQAIKDYILVTGTNGSNNNFDTSPTNTPSLRTYDETQTGASVNGWTNPTNITNTIATGEGFEVFVRGTRGIANPFLSSTVPDNVTFRFSGTMNTGSVVNNLTYTNSGDIGDGLSLVGNPYPSQIDFTSNGITRVNCDDKFWSYNPNTTLYGMYDISVGSGTNSITPYIAPGQGFFVQAINNTSPSITFAESAKTDLSPNDYFNPLKNHGNQLIKLSLNYGNNYSDELIVFIDSTASILSTDEDDALKIFNDALNFYSKSIDKNNLTINNYPIPSSSDTINLSVFSYDTVAVRVGDYFISTKELLNIDSAYTIYLLDKYTNALTEMSSNTRYDFSISTDASSYGDNRFKLILQNNFTGISNKEKTFISKLYPNPANEVLYIDIDSQEKSLNNSYQIIDLLGREISSSTLINNQINIESLPNGVYFLILQNELGVSINRFVKK